MLHQGSTGLGFTGLALLSALVLAEDARAQIQLNRYRAPVIPEDGVALSRPIALGEGRLAGLLAFDYADDPLVLELERGLDETETTSLVQRQVEAQGRIAYGLFDRLVLSAGLDAALVMVGDGYADPATGSTLAPADGTGLGDARLGARYVALGDAESRAAFGVEGLVTLPLARGANADQNLSGERGVTVQSRALGEVRPGRFRVTGKLGVVVRRDARLLDATLGDDVSFGLGAALTLPGQLQRFEVLLEAFGSTASADPFQRVSTPVEVLAGGRWKPTEQWLVSLAGGSGVQRGIGSPDLRAIAALGFAGVEDADPDGDLVPAPDDRCPSDAEDRDGVQDEDGCPDADDADGDGVGDGLDACRGAPEDRDGFQDGDGCPDTDNDGDGLSDESDGCSDRAEDIDGVQDEDGCPDLDNDADGVGDADDACPAEPGAAEAKGCPAVQIAAERIEIRERIQFEPESDALLPESEGVLEQIRALLEQHPELRSLAIDGHSDSSGGVELNRSLSARRAQRVQRWLIEHGIAPERLTAWGCGSSRPLEDEATEEGRRRNRRVELVVLDPASEQAPDRAGCRPVTGGR